MNVILIGRGVDLNDRLRGYATDKFTKVQRFFGKITKMEVELSQERNPRVKDRQRVEVTVVTPGETMRAHGAGPDFFSAIDQTVDRLEIQVKKHKERLKDHSPRTGNGPTTARFGGSTDDGSLEGDAFEDEEGPRIFRAQAPISKPMTPEEAVLELDGSGLQFLLFMNAETMRCGVVYRRKSGDYGLVEHPG